MKHILLSAAALASLVSFGKVELGAPFKDGCVLQRQKPLPVWGWADPGDSVTVSFAGQAKSAMAGTDGVWHPAVIDQLRVKERKQYVSRGIFDAFRFLNIGSPEVKEPKHLRYLYSGDRAGTIKNEYGLPLGPFHIDVE